MSRSLGTSILAPASGVTGGWRSMSDAMCRFWRMAVMDFRHGYGVWIVLALVAAGCWYFLLGDRREVTLWGYQSVQLSWAFAVIGPVGGGWGAWLAGRNRRARTEALMVSTPVTGVVQDARALVVPAAGALGAYTVIVLVVLVRSAMEATWGGPVWTVLLYGAALIAGYTVVGTVAGMLVPARLTPFIVAGALFLFTVVTYSAFGYNSDYRYLAPYEWVSNPDRYDQLLYHPYDDVPVSFGAAFGLVLGVVAASLAALAWARHGRLSGNLLGIGATIILVPSLFATVDPDETMPSYAAVDFSGSNPSLYGAIENPPLVCGGQIIETCVHQAFQGQLDDVSRHADAIVAPVADLPGVPARLEQRADQLSTDDVIRFSDTWQWGDADFVIERVTVNALFPSPVLFDSAGYDSEYDRTTAQAAIGQWLVQQAGGRGYFTPEIAGVPHPIVGPGNPPEQVMEEYWDEVDRINSEINDAAQRFASLPAEEQRAWLELNWDALRAGELTLEELP